MNNTDDSLFSCLADLTGKAAIVAKAMVAMVMMVMVVSNKEEIEFSYVQRN